MYKHLCVCKVLGVCTNTSRCVKNFVCTKCTGIHKVLWVDLTSPGEQKYLEFTMQVSVTPLGVHCCHTCTVHTRVQQLQACCWGGLHHQDGDSVPCAAPAAAACPPLCLLPPGGMVLLHARSFQVLNDAAAP